MWPWIKRWRDWVMRDGWPMHRTGPQPQALHFSYEKAGLTIHDQPIPWNAEAVLVEGCIVRLPANGSRRKTDFQLRVSGQELLSPESIRRDEHEDRHRFFFRLPPLTQTATAELLYRNHPLGQVTLPFLSREEFLNRLQLQMPTLFVRFNDQSVACRTYVATQCRGLLASALITSPTSLVPLLDLGLQIELRSERAGTGFAVPARLCSSQLSGRQALVTIVPRRYPKRIGTWTVTWKVAERALAAQQLRAISQAQFRKSLRVSSTRFIVQRHKGELQVTRHVPPFDEIARLGPCFLVSSREPGMAGICGLQVRAQVSGNSQSPLLLEEEVLITDGPTEVAPGTIEGHDLSQVTAFEMRSKSNVLGVLSLCPTPVANFTSEGGFKTASDFPWTPAAEDELNDRLSKLLEPRSMGS